MKLIRYSFVFLFGLLLLAACWPLPDAVPVTIISETADSRTIEHTYGTTEVPVDPQRIIALGEDGVLADLVDSGVTPVFSIVNDPNAVTLLSAEELEGIELLSSSGQVSLETLVAYNPDLIVGSIYFVNEAGFNRLSEIAPTVAVNTADPLVGYIETATVLGLRTEAEAEVEAFRQQIESTAVELGAGDVTVTVATVYTGPSIAIWFEDASQSGPAMLDALGVTLLPSVAERDDLSIRNGRAYISEERLDLIAGEMLVLLQSGAIEGEAEALEEVAADHLWQKLPAIEQDNVIVLDRLGYPGFRGQQALLNDLADLISFQE